MQTGLLLFLVFVCFSAAFVVKVLCFLLETDCFSWWDFAALVENRETFSCKISLFEFRLRLTGYIL